jgi:hypothetical protein
MQAPSDGDNWPDRGLPSHAEKALLEERLRDPDGSSQTPCDGREPSQPCLGPRAGVAFEREIGMAYWRFVTGL